MVLKIILLPALLLMSAVYPADAKAPDIVLKQKNTVVTVYVDGRNDRHIASAAGFIIDQDGIIVTNCGIIGKWITEPEASLSVEVEGRDRFSVDEVISSKCENNLALLKIKASGLATVKIARDFNARQGGDIVVIKGSRESDRAVYSGKIRSVGENGRYYQISLPMRQEDSGSPLFNLKGEAVGAAIVQKKRGKSLNFAVSLKEISKQLDRYVKPKKLVESSINRPKTDEAPERKTDDIQDYFSRGCTYDQSGMYKEALEAYRQALKINPDFVDTYINLGIDYYRLGRYADAIDVFNRAIQIKPDLISVYTKLGASYIVSGEYSLAISVLEKASGIEPGNPSIHFNLGIAYFLSGDTNAARKECAVLRDIDKTKADSLNDLMD